MKGVDDHVKIEQPYGFDQLQWHQVILHCVMVINID